MRMDRQKTIPPLSTKITRKLAQESADHNTLMNFYSQISRDESGAPKKWKMSSNLHIDEDSIKSKKLGTGKGSRSATPTRGTPTSSRESSNERRNSVNASLQKAQKGGRRSREPSSSDQNSSRESSLESKGEEKKTKEKKKRGPRPKSLDLSPDTMANGDEDHFKSPDPLTPCNITVKRKKGRPKETPPVLYAEPPVETSVVENSVSDEDQPTKRKPGRPKKIKRFDRNKFKSIPNVEKLKSFNMKRFENKGLKQYGSKINKTTLAKGFRRVAKCSAAKHVPPVAVVEDDAGMESDENEEKCSGKDDNTIKENGFSSEKRKPGRPPGAKNKLKLFTAVKPFKTRAKVKFGLQKVQVTRRPGRPPGAKNKATLLKLAEKDESEKVDTVSEVTKEDSNEQEVAEENTSNELELFEMIDNMETEVEEGIVYDNLPPYNEIDEAIDAVVYKARNDISLESNVKPKVPFRSTIFYKKRSTVKSAAKFKKEKDALNKIRRKRILKAQAHSNSNHYLLGSNIDSLASNDLRRKLHSKLIERLSNEANKASLNENKTVVEKNVDSAENTETNVTLEEKKIVSDSNSFLVPPKEIEHGEEITLKYMEKSSVKPEIEQQMDGLKAIRRQYSDLTKFSDTESVCSELSTNSFGSVKRSIEKQVLILGEDQIDSDDQTVRTRQRFEIIPGKKRKRTLSGEFDLLDEKQLRNMRKERRKEKGETDEETDKKTEEVVTVKPIRKPLFKRKTSPLKKSPNLKVHEGKIVKKYVTQLAYRNRLLKQSPFLSRVRKRRRKPFMKREAGGFADNTNIPNTDLKLNDQVNTNSVEISGNSELLQSDSKIESHRQGLFEKFADESLQSNANFDQMNEVNESERQEIKSKKEEINNDSDDTEGTVELREELYDVEESVDDSIIDFHTEEEKEDSGNILYTESEIEIREMIFDLIDSIVIKSEAKKIPNSDIVESAVKEDIDKHNPDEVYSLKKNLELKGDLITNKENENQTSEELIKTESVKDSITLSEEKSKLEPMLGVSKETNLTTKEDNKDSAADLDIKDLSESKDRIASDTSAVAEMVENQRNLKTKMKHKVGRGRFGRKIVTENVALVNEVKVRKKPGRKPKHLKNALVNEADDEKLDSKTKGSPNETKSSPETGITRKFELRQKISRSPLDNIALKQSMEENVYLRTEAQKLSRKEAKLNKIKNKMAMTESLDSISYPSDTTETADNLSADLNQLSETETADEMETSFETVDDLTKRCKPCKVVLKDFIKELERKQEVGSSSESELERADSGENRQDDENVSIDAASGEKITEIYDNSVVSETNVNPGTETLNNESRAEQISSDNFATKANDSSESVNVKSNESPNKQENTQSIQQSETTLGTSPRKPRGPKSKRATPVKAKEIASPKTTVNSPRELRKGNSISEQQTARKTVPPLKIKLKGGFSSRRKTYMVEPSPDSPVEQTSKPDHKLEKKKFKSKSGSRSESDSEKHSKGHHHKKRNKTPTDESIDPFKGSANHAEASGNAISEKSSIRPTDAYEATFLQFIQDKGKVEQGLASLSNSMKSKLNDQSNKSVYHHEKSNKKASRVQTPPVSSSNVEQMQVNSDAQIDADMSEVQYVCSQCDNVVYKAKEQIIQHYRDVHPGLQFIYKPLPEAMENAGPATESTTTTPLAENVNQAMTSVQQSFVGQSQPVEVEDDDDDSGSLNLKIVEVVSLKEQQNIIDSVVPKVQVPVITSMPPGVIPTELRIPSYPVQTGAPPLYANKIGLPPSYSVATSNHLNTVVKDAKLKPVLPKPRMQGQSVKIGNSFKCEKCNVHAPMLAAMVAHLRNSHKEIPRLFQCPYCKNMEAETEAQIHQHIQKLHPTNNPNPPVALSEPAKRNLKTLAIKLPDGVKFGEGNSIERDIYMCLKCKEHMPSLETIYEHLEHEHSEVFAYVCPVCKKFKSKNEDLVNKHIIMNHRQNPMDVNVSLAIDGNHFVRVQCLLKDKTKPAQKISPPAPLKQPVVPVSNVMHLGGNILQLQPVAQTVIPQMSSPANTTSTTRAVSAAKPLGAGQTSTNKQIGLPPQKKKKSLLESIQKIKDQKGLKQPDEPSAAQVPSHPSQLGVAKNNSTVGGVPPPLMRGPPPLIRYDQLSKVTSAQSALFGSTVKTSSQFTPGQGQQKMQFGTLAQTTQSATAARPIQSSLFDTSDLESIKSPQNQRPVLNVPVVSRSSKSPFPNKPVNSIVVTTGSPLDLSKSPSGSPAPPTAAAGSIAVPATSGINPDIFKVFNLRPTTQMQLPRQHVPVQQMLAQPIMLPQQVRQNTPSTLAYRPPAGQQLMSTSQVQQIIGMPMPVGAVIGNMVVSLGNVTPSIQSIPGVTQIQTLQSPQFVRMAAPQLPLSAVNVITSTVSSPAATSTQTKSTGKQTLPGKHILFKCPYCPNLTPLRFDQVQPHIENRHRGSSVLYKPFDSI